ncbi:Ig-like domain-containing protein, partial [Pseudorhodobacter sp.]|uniref:cadherin-like domain-containing protein n=1 Tax=Pseudorhodobacter sp. TaxID=1934400 RepID=UPI0039E4D7A6
LLTFGQQYFWGVELHRQSNDKQHESEFAEAAFTVEPRRRAEGERYASVTVVTHGFSAPFIGGVLDATSIYALAKAIAANSEGVVMVYSPQFAAGGTDPGRIGNWVALAGNPLTANALVLVPDWTDASVANEGGFAEAAADAFYADIVKLEDLVPGLLKSPLHFIGQDRGAAVNSEIIQRLLVKYGAEDLGKIHVTTIDPMMTKQPQMVVDVDGYLDLVGKMATLTKVGLYTLGLGSAFTTVVSGGATAAVTGPLTATSFRFARLAAKFETIIEKTQKAVTWLGFDKLDYSDFRDPIVVNWAGVDYADNYFQTAGYSPDRSSFTTVGAPVPTADVNLNLNQRPGFFEDDAVPNVKIGLFSPKQYGFGVGTLNARAVGWYLGTADVSTQTFVGAGGSMENIWRGLSDRFAEVKTAYSAQIPFFSSVQIEIGKLARFYNDKAESGLPPSATNIKEHSDAYEKNLRSWYIAREEEKTARGDKINITGNTPEDWEGVATGWFYSALGGGALLRATDPSAVKLRAESDPVTLNNSPDSDHKEVLESIFNGNFEASYRPFFGRVPVLDRSMYEIPGWSFQGGGLGNLENLQPELDQFSSATKVMGLPLPGLSSLALEFDTTRIVHLLIEKGIASSSSDAQPLATMLGDFIKLFFPESGAEIAADRSDPDDPDADIKVDPDKSFLENLPAVIERLKSGELLKVLEVFLDLDKIDTDIFGYITDGDRWDKILDKADEDTLKEAQRLHRLHMTEKFVRAKDPNGSLAQLEKDWAKNTIKSRDTAKKESKTAAKIEAMLDKLPAILTYLQDQFAAWSFEIQPNDALIHNTMRFPDTETQLGIDVKWTAGTGGWTSFPAVVNEIKVSAEINGVLKELVAAPGYPTSLTSGNFGHYERVLFTIPDDVKGKTGRLIIQHRPAAAPDSAANTDIRLYVDNISFKGGVTLTETSGDTGDLNLFFSDKGQVLPDDATGKAVLTTAENTGAGKDRQVITLRNTEKEPVTIRVHIDQNDFVTLVGQRGDWQRAGSSIGLDKLDTRTQSVSLTVTLQANEFAELAVEAAVSPDALDTLLGEDGIAMLTSKMAISWPDKGGTGNQIRQSNLFYLLDAGDGSVTDGLLDMAPVADVPGGARIIRIPVKGALATDTDLSASILNTGDFAFFSDVTKDGSYLVYHFTPTSLGAAGVGPDQVTDTGTLDFAWNGLKIGSVDLRGKAVKSQIINLDLEGLRAAVTAELARLVAANPDPESEESLFAAQFTGLAEAQWGVVAREVYNRVLSLLSASGSTDFRISEGNKGSLDLIFEAGAAPWGTLEDGAEAPEVMFRRLGLASFDFAPAKDGNAAANTTLDKLLNSAENAKLTGPQKRFLLDQLFNQRRFGDKVVLDSAALFNALKPAAGNVDFNGIEAFATLAAWAYAHEIVHTLGAPDMYDFASNTRLPNAGLMGQQGDFVLSAELRDIIKLASDNPQAYLDIEVDRLIAFLGEMRQAGMLNRGDGTGRDYAFSPFTGSVPLVGTGWHVLGQVEKITDGLLLIEANTARTAAVRTFVLPAEAKQLTFTLRSQMTQVAGQVPDAFEIGLLNALGEAFTVVGGLSNTDAALNLQAGGLLRLANGLTASAVVTTADGWQERKIVVDLAAINAAAQLTLSFDLLGFGARDAQIEILDLEFDVPPVEDNRLPVAMGGGSATGVEDTPIEIDLRSLVSDPDGDPVVPVIDRNPAHGTLAKISAGIYRYTPAENFNGDDSFTFAASDGKSLSLPVTFAIRVTPVNDAPVITSQAAASVAEGQELSLQLTATDPDGDSLHFTLISGPAGATLTADGLLRWVAGPVGARDFQVTVSDGAGGTASQTLRVTVTNLAPTVTLQLPASAVLGELVTATIGYSDPGGAAAQLSIDWGDGTVETVSAGNLRPGHTYAAPGDYLVKVFGTDAATPEVSANLAVKTPGLFVSALTAGPWGVNVRFNAPVDIGLPNPYTYASRPGEPVDILLLDADGRPVTGSLLPDADSQGFTLITSGDGLAPGTYRLRLTGDTIGWRSQWDLLSNGPQGYLETSFDISETPVQVFLQEAIQTPGKALGSDGQGLDIRLEQAGGLRSLLLALDWDASLLDIQGLVSDLPGVTITRELWGSGAAHFRIQFLNSPQAGRIVLGQIEGKMRQDIAYGTIGRPFGVTILEINGVAQNMASKARTGDRVMALSALWGDATGDSRMDEEDEAVFAQVDQQAMMGLEAWRNIDPGLLRIQAGTGGSTGGNTGGSTGGGTGSNTSESAGGNAGSASSGGSASSSLARLIGGASGPVALTNTASIGLSANLINAAFDPVNDRVFYSSDSRGVMFGAATVICLVPEGQEATAARIAQAKKNGLCFAGQPVDLVDEDQRWRLVGITEMTPGADTPPKRERRDDGNVCIVVDTETPFTEGQIFSAARALLPEQTEDGPPKVEPIARHRQMCFEVSKPDVEVKLLQDTPPEITISTAEQAGDGAVLMAMASFVALTASLPNARTGERKRHGKALALLDETHPQEWSAHD